MIGLARLVTGAGGGHGPSLNFNFVDGSAFSPQITFTRASTATFFNSSGVLTSAAIDAPRLDYDPSTLTARGLLIEEQRTNSVRNNTMQGAVAGTPGTLPTNWAGTGSPADGLTRTVVGVGAENGINYIDVRYNGTTSAASFHALNPELIGAVAALAGQSWTYTTYISVVAGSTANINAFDIGINEYSSVPAFLVGSSITISISAGSISSKRYTFTRTLTNASTASVHPFFVFTYNSGVAIDITLRIGLPQLEQGAFATSVIPTTTTALTRSADVAKVNTMSPWFNASEGTLFAEGVRLVAGSVSGVLVGMSQTNLFDQSIYAANEAALPNAINLAVVNGGVSQAALGSNVTVTSQFKMALAYKANDFAGAINGAAPVTDTSGTVPTPMENLAIGSAPWDAWGGTSWFGYVRRITYYPRRLSNAELQAITA